MKLFSCSTQLSVKSKMLTNIKIAKIIKVFRFGWPKPISLVINVGILISMSRINFMLSLVEHEKRFITSKQGNLFYSYLKLLQPLLSEPLRLRSEPHK